VEERRVILAASGSQIITILESSSMSSTWCEVRSGRRQACRRSCEFALADAVGTAGRPADALGGAELEEAFPGRDI